jgi:transposase
MFFRVLSFPRKKDKTFRQYLQIVETYREGGKVKQRILLSLGRVDELRASGELDRMADALARLSERQKIVDFVNELVAPAAGMFGPVPVFRHLWKRLCLPAAIADAVDKETFFAYDMEAATFRMVLGRLLDPKSKFATHRWAKKVYWDDGENVDLQHYYRALGVLSRNVKRMEENLYFAGRDLFTPAPDLLFFDTTSVYFEGEGPTGGLGQYYYSKDNRPDRKQMIVGVVMTREGTPLAHHVFPGNTPDAAAFSVVIEEMRNRFGIKRVILIGDRGMFNATIIKRIEELEMEYIAGVRMRTVWDVREIVLEDKAPFETVSENLKVKKVELGGKTYVVCLNEEEARRAKAVREQVVAGLREKIAQGPKKLVGHSLYRKYVRLEKDAVSVNEQKIIDEKKYDGKYVLLTNTNLSAKETALAYKGLWQVERAFREIKSTFEIRPVYLSREDHVRGHVAICFLAFCLQVAFRKGIEEVKELTDHSFESLLESLKELRMIELTAGDKSYRVRTEPDKIATAIFRAVGAPIPRRVTMLEPQPEAAQA